MKTKIWICVITLVLASVIVADTIQQSQVQKTAGTQGKVFKAGGEKEETEGASELLAFQGITEQIQDTKKEMNDMTKEDQKQENAEKQEDIPEAVRVLIKGDDFSGLYHENPQITCTTDFCVRAGKDLQLLPAGKTVTLGEKKWMKIYPVSEDGQLQILNLKRDQTPPSYGGCLELKKTDQGIRVINEVSLEEYLPLVLSSEMSAYFPEEALKAQAVCARTYALKRMVESKDQYYGADLDDSVSFQVYNNRSSTEESRKAVENTSGQVLMRQDALADIYYFSTSSGAGKEDHLAQEADFQSFISGVRLTDFEYQEPWYRWQAGITSTTILKNMETLGMETPDIVEELNVREREESGRAKVLEITGGEKTVIVEGEYEIRQVLSPKKEDLILQDGSSTSVGMLPSAWFYVQESQETEKTITSEDQKINGGTEKKNNGAAGQRANFGQEETAVQEEAKADVLFILKGGGYGHGEGLSQNGAKAMAKAGANFEEILSYYYPDCSLEEYPET